MNELHTTCYNVKTVGFIFSVLHKLEWIIKKKKGFSVYGSYAAAYWFIKVPAFLPVPPALVLSSLIGNIWKIRIVS